MPVLEEEGWLGSVQSWPGFVHVVQVKYAVNKEVLEMV